MVLALIAVAHLAQADRAGHVLQFAVAIGGAGQAVERMVGDVELHHALAQLLEPLGLGVDHHAVRRPAWCRRPACRAGPRSRPGTAGRSRRPRRMSVAQSFGIWVPASIAARMIEVPAGTVTLWPSMVSVTMASRFRSAACRSRFPGSATWRAPLFGGRRRAGAGSKSSGKWFSALITGYGVKPPSAQSEPNFIVLQRSSSTAMFSGHAFAGDDPVDDLDAAGRADPARRALAAAFDGAEFHGEARLLRHVDGVVEHDDAAMADQAVARGEGLVVERRVEQRAREIGAERAADLHRADRPAGQRCRRRCRRPARRA